MEKEREEDRPPPEKGNHTKPGKLTNEQVVEKITKKCMEVAVEEKTSHNWIFDIPGTKNEGIFSLEIKGNSHTISIMARRKGSQYVTMYYLCNGTADEVQAYLKDPEHATLVAKSVWELSESVDDKAGEYPFY